MDATDNVCAHATHDPDNCPIIEDFTLNPGEGRHVPIGIYEKPMEQPGLEISLQPGKTEEITTTLERIEGEHEYTLTYYVQNFSSEPRRIVVKERTA